MISRAAHIALILPDFAKAPVRTETIGIYRYLGGKQWQAIPPALRRNFLHIGV
jgi:hypothetical protein